jgi:hypothetical protein
VFEQTPEPLGHEFFDGGSFLKIEHLQGSRNIAAGLPCWFHYTLNGGHAGTATDVVGGFGCASGASSGSSGADQLLGIYQQRGQSLNITHLI